MIPWIISQPSCHRVILLWHYTATCTRSPGMPVAGDKWGPARDDVPLLKLGLRPDSRGGGQLAKGGWCHLGPGAI